MNVKDDFPVFGENSVKSELEKIFGTMSSIHARTFAGAADLKDISLQQLQVYSLIAGCQNPKLRKKIIGKEVEPTMKSLVATVKE